AGRSRRRAAPPPRRRWRPWTAACHPAPPARRRRPAAAGARTRAAARAHRDRLRRPLLLLTDVVDHPLDSNICSTTGSPHGATSHAGLRLGGRIGPANLPCAGGCGPPVRKPEDTAHRLWKPLWISLPHRTDTPVDLRLWSTHHVDGRKFHHSS